MTILNVPKVHDFGGGDLVELRYLETTFSIPRRVALLYLKALRIRPMYIGDDVFFSLPTFKKIMYVLSRPGSPGFLFPASKAKGNTVLRKTGNFLVEVTDDILAQAASPQIMAEMVASEGRDASMIKKLVAHSIPLLKKDKK
ncbi:hypothetical protein LCGC14_0681560 [marine sediment metagenome]|uniref:Uncharacterized protein n=1 Tax=marine sediment metagenome TaxID=412755 RepID=A0A0F9T9E4_9ZZZZ